jgi:uncharacterized membrane protein
MRQSIVMRPITLSARRIGFSTRSRDDWAGLLAWGLVGLYILTFSWLAIQRYASFNSGFDLGVYNQVVWNSLHGRPFFYTSTGQPLLHFSNHADPILLLLAPFYLIHSGPETLLVLQAGLIGLAGLPVFYLGREKLRSNLAGLSLLLAYLLFPGLQGVTLSDFHPPALAFAFLMFAFYFLEKDRAGRYLLFVVLAMACKEQIPLQVIFLGLYALIWKRKRRLGLVTVLLATGWFLAVMYWVIPTYSVTGDHLFLGFYAEFGDDPVEIVLTVLTRPDLVLKNLAQPARLAYLRDLFAPFAFLPLVGLPALLIGAPSFAINLLSANPAMHDASRGHYVADVAPWLAWGALFGILYLSRGLNRLWPGRQAVSVAALSLVLVGVAWGWQLFHGLTPLALNHPRWTVSEHDQLGQELLSQIPQDAPVSAQIRLYAHVSHRHIAYVFPHIREADYIFLDATVDTSPLHPNNYYLEIMDLLRSGEFGVLAAEDGYLLLQRGLDIPTLPGEFFDFVRAAEVKPAYPLDIIFGEEIQLLGFDVIDDARRRQTGVRLYWRALQPIERDLRLYPFFTDQAGQVIEDTSLRPLVGQIWYPPQDWQPGEVVVTEKPPWSLGDEWSLAVGVLEGDDWSQWNRRLKAQIGQGGEGIRRFETNTWARLASFRRQGRDLEAVTPPDEDLAPPVVVQANFDNKMQLLGYGAAQAGEALTVTLYWQALAEMGYDYTVFVHLVDEAGNPVAQHDGQPWWEVSIPTTTWQPGERLRDRHVLALPPELAEGRYRLRVGVYYWQTLERLPVLENGQRVDNFIELGEITLEQFRGN